jgi:hypothetical protein
MKHILLPLFILGLAIHLPAQQLVTNGALDPLDPLVNVNIHNAVTPAGWSPTPLTGSPGFQTPDTFSADTTFAGYTFPVLSGGGFFTNFVAVDYNQDTIYPSNTDTYEGMFQMINGATVGAIYRLEFDQAIDLAIYGQDFPGAQGYIRADVAGSLFNSTPMDAPTSQFQVSSGWYHQSYDFVAPSSSFELRLTAQLVAPPGPTENLKRIELGIDNVSIVLSPVPEPSGLVLLALAAMTLNLRRLRVGLRRSYR